MKTSNPTLKPNHIVPPPSARPETKPKSSVSSKDSFGFGLTLLLAGLAFLSFGAPRAHADVSPPGCTGSGLGISLFAHASDLHIGDTLTYSVLVFNTPFPACDASGIVAGIVTPDGRTNMITLKRTTLVPGDSDTYTDVVSYVVRAQDMQSDGTVRATAFDYGDIHQNDTNSRGGGFQGVNTQVDLPCIKITATCTGNVGETGAITFTGTVKNCGNTPLIGATVSNLVNNAWFLVLGPIDLDTNQVVSFSGSWVPSNPCSPSTATLAAQGTDTTTSDPRTVTDSVNTTCSNVLTPGIQVTKTCPATPVAPGQPLVFSGTVKNTGNVTLKNIVVVNDQPAPNTPVFTLPSLAPGEEAPFTGNYPAPVGCATASTVTASATSVCGAPVSNSASATCNILTTPSITVNVACSANPVAPGGVLSYSGTVHNGGDIALNNVVVVSDRPAPNTTVFTVASLAPGASANFTGQYTVPATAVCSVTATVIATGKGACSTDLVTDTAAATCPVTTHPGIAVTLACPAAPAAAGGSITYTGTVSNTGDVILNDVVVANNQPAPNTVVFSVPSLAPKTSANFTATFTAPADVCSVTSTVVATGSDACGGQSVSNTATATCPLVGSPAIAVTQDCPASAVGQNGVLTYNGTVKNTGTVTLTNVVVVNDRSGTTPVFTANTLAPGSVATFTGSYPVPTDACSVSSTVSVRATSICGVAVTSSSSATCPILSAPRITVTVACSANPVAPGGVLSYSGTVHNGGDITLNNVVVVSDRPAPNTTVFTAASLAPGASANFTGQYTVPATAVCSVTANVTATGKGACSTDLVTDSAATTCPITTHPSMAVTLACPSAPVATGGSITYTGTVSNTGDVTLNNVVVANNQPAPDTVVLTVSSLAPKASTNFTATFTAPDDACSVSSAVVATGSDACSEISVSNTASATCPLVGAPQIAVTEECPSSPVGQDGVLTFSGSVKNSGNVTLTNVLVVGQLGGSTAAPSDTIWFDDALPAGARVYPTNVDPWTWVTNNPTPFSGARAHQSSLKAGFHQHYFYGATATLSVNTGDIMLAYVYLDPANVPSQMMLQWDDGAGDLLSWPHRAYWGANLIFPSLSNGTDNRYMGPMPAAGQWVRLEVPASAVGLEGHTLNAMAFALWDGRATWDAAGKSSVSQAPPTPATTFFTAATLAPGAVANFTGSYQLPANSGCSITSTLTASANERCTGSRVAANTTATCPILTNPKILVTQDCPATPPGQGGLLTYTGTVSNPGNVTLSNIVVFSNRPASNTVVFTTAFLPPGGSANFTGSYTVPSNCCSVWSTVTATGTDCGGIVVTDAETQTCPVLTVPEIVVTKVCPTLPVAPGEVLQYSGTVSNAGNIALVDVTVVSSLPQPDSLILGPIDLMPGESVPYFAAYTASADFCGTDTVTARGLDGCTAVPVVDSVMTTCPVVTSPRIAVTHTCPPQPTPKGGVHTFTGTVSNPGNVTLNNVVVVISEPSVDTPVIGPITLPPGGSADFTGSFTAPTCCCEFTDTITAHGQDNCTSALVSATSSTVCPLLSTPSITVTRVCPETPVSTGGLFAYSGSVSNTGDVVLTNVFVFSNQPTPNTPVIGPIELAPGESEEFTGSYTVAAGSDPALDTVQASGTDICQARTVTAQANCAGPVPAAGEFAIDPPVVVDGWLRITWSATPGATYCLQSKSGAKDAVWKTLPGNVTATGTTASAEDSIESGGERLYRVMRLQK
jgi:uncharacterized repeat protein (TIGR01451 family)